MKIREWGKRVIFDYTDETDKKCKLFHKWYYGIFAVPVYGRHERHCLDCPERQYKHKNGTWVSYKIWEKLLRPFQSLKDSVPKQKVTTLQPNGTLDENINTVTLINTEGVHLMRLE